MLKKLKSNKFLALLPEIELVLVDSARNLTSIIWSVEQVFSAVTVDKKENLNINIPTKERIANLDIFSLFYQNFPKITKVVLTAVAENATENLL